ncbi:MAG: AhpC/TSA family protein [Chlorobi bacterium]|nr:AhpC/TSA family protein [Chlorobiota bacterium]
MGIKNFFNGNISICPKNNTIHISAQFMSYEKNRTDKKAITLKSFLFTLIIIFLYSCNNNGYIIKGKIKGATDGTVYLKQYQNKTTIAVDSAKLHNGKFIFTGKVDTPVLYLIYYSGSNTPIALFLENKKIKIYASADSLDKAVITGSPVTDLFIKFNKEMPFLDRKAGLQKDYRKALIENDTATIKKLTRENARIVEAQRKYYKDFVFRYDTSIVSAYLATRMVNALSVDELKKLIGRYEKSIGNHPYVKELKSILTLKEQQDKLSKATAIGSTAPDFMFMDKNGKKITLSSYKGRYILIDFWASWCKPCRRENPYTVEAYRKFRNKGFEILGISLDDDTNSWKRAIKEDNLTWPQFNDPDGMVAKIYGINSIPSSFLIDKDGKIIAKNLRGNALIKKLEDIFK